MVNERSTAQNPERTKFSMDQNTLNPSAGSNSGHDIFFCYTPDQESFAQELAASLPVAPDGKPWRIFMGNGRCKIDLPARDVTPTAALATGDSVASLGLHQAENENGTIFASHAKAFNGTPNFILLCTGDSFVSKTMDRTQSTVSTENSAEIDILQKITSMALDLSSTINIVAVYSSDFKIPKPAKLQKQFVKLLTCDFYKCELDDPIVRDIGFEAIANALVCIRSSNPKPKKEWETPASAVKACMDTLDTDLQLRCFKAFQLFAITVEGQRALYQNHAIQAFAQALRQNSNIDLLVEAMRLCSILAMNNFDLKHRIAGLAVEGGVGAIVESLIKLIRDKDVAQEVEDKIMTVACNLFKRLRANDHTLLAMRTSGAVQILKYCLGSARREVRNLAEETMCASLMCHEDEAPFSNVAFSFVCWQNQTHLRIQP